jgi:hypothetical protein
VFIPSSELGPPHTPPSASVSPLRHKEGMSKPSNNSLRVREWKDPIQTTGKKAWHSLYCVGEYINTVSAEVDKKGGTQIRPISIYHLRNHASVVK